MYICRGSIFLIVLLLNFGCAPIPKYETAQLLDSCDLDQTITDALSSGNFEQSDWPKSRWWEQFEDAELNRLIESALRTSPTLQYAEASLRAAQQVARQKKSALFPEVNFAADNNWQHLAQDGFYRFFAKNVAAVVNDVHLGLQFSYEFDFWGKNRNLFRASLGEAMALAAEKLQTELILTTSVAYTYSEAQFLSIKKSLLFQIKEHRDVLEAIALKRKKHGIDTALTPLSALKEELDTEAMILETEEELERKLHQLKALSALGQGAIIVIGQDLTPLSPGLPENISLDLISRRPDLIAATARFEAAARRISAARTNFYPNINILGLIGWETVRLSSLFQSKNYSASIDPAIHLPLFTAGRLQAELREKVAEFDQAAFSYNGLILQAASEVADRLSDLIILQKSIQVRNKSYKAVQEKVKIHQQRLLAALDNQIDLLTSEIVSLKEKLLLVELQFGKRLATILLIRALGGGDYAGS